VSGTIRATANDILNQVGVEVGLDPAVDPFSSNDQSYSQLSYLINTAGEELSYLYPWEFLRKKATIITTGANSYDLPDDFLYLLNQTVWDYDEDEPLVGPITPQNWAELEARDTAGTTAVYFRMVDDQIALYPEAIAAGKTIKFEYINRNWVLDSDTGTSYKDKVTTGADIPQFNRTLLGRMLKVKFLEAKGFDTTKAQADLNQAFGLMTARNKGAPILSIAPSRRGKLINSYNAPDSGYGS